MKKLLSFPQVQVFQDFFLFCNPEKVKGSSNENREDEYKCTKLEVNIQSITREFDPVKVHQAFGRDSQRDKSDSKFWCSTPVPNNSTGTHDSFTAKCNGVTTASSFARALKCHGDWSESGRFKNSGKFEKQENLICSSRVENNLRKGEKQETEAESLVHSSVSSTCRAIPYKWAKESRMQMKLPNSNGWNLEKTFNWCGLFDIPMQLFASDFPGKDKRQFVKPTHPRPAKVN